MQRLLHGTILLLGGLTLVQGCRSSSTDPPRQATYQIRGTVVSSDAANAEVTIDAEAVPGLMSAMTMPYKLAQPGVAAELHPGDRLTARLQIADSVSVIDQIDVIAQAQPDYKPSKLYNVPQAGQKVPNFSFLNQDGRTITLDQFRGKVLLLTFIYARCPLPDYCIRMSRNFAAIQQKLAAAPLLDNRVHLLSVSFDPAYDTPQVLRSYGNQYTGERGSAAFAHWDFAVPPSSELDAVDRFFDVGVTPGNGGTLTHSLSTVVIAPNGTIFRWYPSNEWTPSAVMDDARQALARLP